MYFVNLGVVGGAIVMDQQLDRFPTCLKDKERQFWAMGIVTFLVWLFLNDVEISRAYANENPKETNFDFFKGDILRLSEVNTGIIKLYSLKMSSFEFL